MDFPEEDYSSDEEGPDNGVQLLHVASLEMNGISNKRNASENDEWWEVVQVCSSALYRQLGTGAYVSEINTTQLYPNQANGNQEEPCLLKALS